MLNSENNFVVVWDSRGQVGPQERIYEQHFGIDTDRDSFLDVNDNCPLSDNPLDNIEIDGCDSGVQDVMLSNPLGCSIQDQILLLADVAKSHGQFKSRVAKLLKSWQKSGILEPDESDAIKQCVAQSSLPR